MPRRELTRAQALAWNPNWSYTDRQTIEEHVDRLEAVTFYRPPSGGYIGCENAAGNRVMFVHAGYIEFARGHGPAVLVNPDWEGIGLSTFRPKSGPGNRARPGPRSCPVHGMPVLAGIGCESCN